MTNTNNNIVSYFKVITKVSNILLVYGWVLGGVGWRQTSTAMSRSDGFLRRMETKGFIKETKS